MLFSVSFEQLFFFEFAINIPCFILLFDLFSFNDFILNDYMFILPGSPYFVLNFLFLLWCLLNGGNDASFPSIYFDHLILFHLLDDHLSSSLLSLVLFLFVLTVRQSTFLSCLNYRSFPIRLSLNLYLLRSLFFIRRWLFAFSAF